MPVETKKHGTSAPTTELRTSNSNRDNQGLHGRSWIQSVLQMGPPPPGLRMNPCSSSCIRCWRPRARCGVPGCAGSWRRNADCLCRVCPVSGHRWPRPWWSCRDVGALLARVRGRSSWSMRWFESGSRQTVSPPRLGPELRLPPWNQIPPNRVLCQAARAWTAAICEVLGISARSDRRYVVRSKVASGSGDARGDGRGPHAHRRRPAHSPPRSPAPPE